MTKVASGYGQKSMLIADNCQQDATQASDGHAAVPAVAFIIRKRLSIVRLLPIY